MTRADYPDLIQDAAALWAVTASEGFGELVEAATEALVAELDSPSLRTLAGESGSPSFWALQPLVRRTLDELGRDYLQGETAQVAAIRAMCRRFERGLIDELRLTSWVLHAIGWDGTNEAREFLELEAAYSEVEAMGLDKEALDKDTRQEVRRFLG